MPSALVSTEIVVGTLLAIAILVLVVTFLRRRYISRGLPMTLCGMRSAGSERWRVGLLRFGDNALEWYALGGVSLRPRHRWQRRTLLIEVPAPLQRDEQPSLVPDASRVRCTVGRTVFDLALQRTAYTALRSWQEASPPGYNVNVA